MTDIEQLTAQLTTVTGQINELKTKASALKSAIAALKKAQHKANTILGNNAAK